MAKTTRLQDTVDSALVDGIEALAKATGRRRGEVLEQAMRLLLDPVPMLLRAQDTVAAYQQRMKALEDQVRVIADYVVDVSREREEV